MKTASFIYAHSWDELGEDRIRRWPSEMGGKRNIDKTLMRPS